MHKVFRDEVVKLKASSVFGGVHIHSSSISSLLVLAAIALSAAVVALLIHGSYAPKERVSGFLTPSKGLIRVYPPDDGIIESILVKEGDMVSTQQTLFSISSSHESVSGTDVSVARMESLLEEHNALEAQLSNEQRLAKISVKHKRGRIKALGKQIELIEARQESVAQRVLLLKKDIERIESLVSRGHIAVAQLDARLIEFLDVREQQQALERERARLLDESGALEFQIEQLPLQHDLRISDLRSRLLGVERALAAADAQWSRVVRAPTGGKITGLLTHESMHVTPDHPVMIILPMGAQIYAELLIPSSAAGFVKPGQEVRLRLDAFPFQKFGLQAGHITSVSQTALYPEDQTGPLRLPEPAYRAVVKLESQHIVVQGKHAPIRPGMLLEADIVRERRRLIEWIFEPLFTVTRSL